jgi:hypothetical protein
MGKCGRGLSPAYSPAKRIKSSPYDLNRLNGEYLMKFKGQLTVLKSHICWGDDGRIYWNDRLLKPVGYTIFLPF